MRILMVSDVYFPRVNGVSTSIQTLRQALARAGHTSVLVVPDYPAAQFEADIVRVPGWQIPRDPEDRLMYPHALAAALDTLDPADFDIVHIHTPFLAHRVGVRWARKHGLPCVETYHTLFEEYFHHYLPFLPKSWLAAAARMISRKECDGVTAVIAPSSAMKSALIGYGVSSPIHIIPTGLRLADFAACDGAAFRARHDIAPERPVIACVGRVAFEKNLDFLLQVTETTRRSLPDVLFVIAGEGPARASLEKAVVKRGLGDNVRFIGYLERRTELPGCYCAADVFVFASKTETQGLVLLESMALGVPVVGLAEMGTKDVLQEGEGCRIAPDDVAGFARVLLPLLTDRTVARQLGEAGKHYAAGWSEAQMETSMLQLYQSLAAAGEGGRDLSVRAAG
ncbi:MAG TPA: glycosyltransferase [Thiobacillus sp.]|nr:MAG: glycosyl transferase family 1 [Hydrogenophilales bacterium 28-61-11]OYZ57558.1 MAG: glycosyl transferase family 1 [Hydrogenophilales bacterium 16-61-112]OZA50086.1 MAG: glycosyl transferase family 1 [Hydrogenophilales bacterium 17-61-76]HQT30287.1 glycosyltransferase [Thiobacillus sp.]HQT69777.1 glycosyltransferase [Thiobacillus sp.]